MINATSKSNQNYEPLAAGVYLARCYYMCELGTIPIPYKGENQWKHRVHIRFELPTELKEFKEGEGLKPYSVSSDYTLSTHKKSGLRAMLGNWRGKALTDEEAESFDITKLLGVPCMISVVHNKVGDKTYANIGSISAVAKGMTCPPQINPTFEFSLSENFNQAKFDSLPDWLKDKIKTSDEYKALMNPEHTEATPSSGSEEPQPDNDLPFRVSPEYFKFTL